MLRAGGSEGKSSQWHLRPHGRKPAFVQQTSCCIAGKDRIEQLLALGATRWEATQASLQRCARVALTPILNQMNVVGIVSIPGEQTPVSACIG